MKTPCEFVAAKIIPSLRAKLVRILLDKYGMKQVEVSRILDITQASVSQYASNARGNYHEIFEMHPWIEREIEEIAKKIINGKKPSFCGICKRILRARNNHGMAGSSNL